MTDMTGLLEGKSFLVTGAANPRSIAWAVAKAVKRHGGAVALTYQAERLRRRVGQLAEELGGAPMIELDVASDTAVRPGDGRAGGAHAGARRPGAQHRLGAG